MTPNLTLCVLVGVLFAVGVYLLLARSVSRSLMGLLLLGNGANILFMIAGGPAGRPPIIGGADESEMSDPLPQAMVLTAIVITLGMTAFLLALAYRSWQLHRHDEVQDDVEDRRIAQIAAADAPIFADSDAEATTDLDREAAEARDETQSVPAVTVGASTGPPAPGAPDGPR